MFISPCNAVFAPDAGGGAGHVHANAAMGKKENVAASRKRFLSFRKYRYRQEMEKFDASVLIVVNLIRNLCRKMYILGFGAGSGEMRRRRA